METDIDQHSMSDYWRMLTKHRFVIFFCFLLMLGATFFFTRAQKTVYTASCTIRVSQQESKNSIAAIMGSTGDPFNAEIRILKSEAVVKAALAKTGLTYDAREITEGLEVQHAPGSDQLEIRGYADGAEKVALLVNSIAASYIEKSSEELLRLQRERKQYLEAQIKLQSQLLFLAEEKVKDFRAHGGVSGVGVGLANKMVELNSDIDLLKQKYTDAHPEILKKRAEIAIIEDKMAGLSGQDATLIRLIREVGICDSLYRELRRNLLLVEMGEVGQPQNVQIVSEAVVPSRPIRPNYGLNLGIGALLGLIIGGVVAFLFEGLDATIGSVEDLEKFLGLQVLGIIPRATDELKSRTNILSGIFGKRKGIEYLRNHLLLWYSPKSALVEAYHTLRTNISFAAEADKQKVLAFTSAGPGEGKTFTIINYALSAAAAGKRVVLVESDLRRPTINRIFGFPGGDGFSDILRGRIGWKECLNGTSDFIMNSLKLENIAKAPGIEFLKVITCGKAYSNSLDMGSSVIMDTVLSELKANFDLVLLDCPPVLLFADATIVCSKVDGVVMVYQSGRTSRLAVKRAKSQLEKVRAKMLGIVLNDVSSQMMPYYGGYYYNADYYKSPK